ncbi:MAG TPA: hypothetical protein VM536_16545 [Chloroflexia bacterium]|nr:hypothetical protein [Chloroflexia bacterium]
MSDVAGLPAPDGTLVPSDRLGPGIVQARAPGGALLVEWLDAHVTTWVASDDVQALGAGRHLVSVWRRDTRGQHRLLRRHLSGLSSHWEVELLPKGVIRSVRADGCCWTFTINALTREVTLPWDEAPTDDAAEAICAAELAMQKVSGMHGITHPGWW